MPKTPLVVLVALGLATITPAAAADSSSLLADAGPAILHDAPAQAPQLTNTAPWTAAPILTSGATAYRDGEFLYQDFLYDDHGAKGTRDPGDPRTLDTFSAPNGTFTYPTGPGYNANAADLVEVRVKPMASATAFRLTFNTMVDPELMAASLALGASPQSRPLPFGANASAPAAFFVTWHGSTADLRDAATGQPAAAGAQPAVTVDLARRQVQIVVPKAGWDPGRDVQRLAVAAGLWDRAAGAYLLPAPAADATRPGGAGSLSRPTAFFNVAFRSAEPFQSAKDTSALTDPAWWRDRLQGNALAADGDLTPFHADVDFAKLADRTGDERGVPQTGALNRILASHVETRQGIDFSVTCIGKDVCQGEYRGRLQPYALYVPAKAPTGGRYPLTLLLHSLTANYNQFSSSANQRQFGERSRASIVITPEARGPDGFYRDMAAADVFEVWADVAARHKVDPQRTTITGYSMGGFGTYKLAAQYPDLFARAQPTVGAAGVPLDMLASVRWVPFLAWNARADELVPPKSYEPTVNRLRALGYRYEADVYAPVAPPPPAPTPQHLMLAINDQFAPAAGFLGANRVERDPPRVTYVRNAAYDAPAARTTADHAYWLSRISFRRKGAKATAFIDVRSQGFGRGEPRVSPVVRGSGTLTGGFLGTRPFTREARTWRSAPRRARRDVLTVVARNVAAVRVDATRARVSCRAKVRVTSDGPISVRLVHCPGA